MAESESSNDTAEYAQGIINGRAFRGWVGITRLQEGDDVEMVAEWQHDHYEVYAIALPKERIVSIIPKCDMGQIAHALWRAKNMFILAGILLSMFIGVCLIRFLLERGGGVLRILWVPYIYNALRRPDFFGGDRLFCIQSLRSDTL
ncbi:hypothetical protein D3C76_972290 [compost metagenome]